MNRNDPLTNSYAAKCVAQNLTATLRALGRIGFNRDMTVLDIGGGGGGSLLPYMLAGAPAKNLAVADKDEKGTAEPEIASRFPGVRFFKGDAEKLPIADDSFDIVIAVGMLYQITDETKAKRIASEMRRVCRGLIIVNDWSVRFPRLQDGRGITASWCERIFETKALFTQYVQPHPFDRLLRAGPLSLPFGKKIRVMKA